MMSLPKEDIRGKVSPDIHKMIKIMAEFDGRSIQEWVSLHLEKVAVAEFHEYSLLARKMARAGLTGNEGDK